MAEDFSESEELTEKEKAALRWQAVQGFNAAPVPPLAARLGIALICHMDARERLCYVGELRLSHELGAHLLSIQKAKKQLKEAGLISWTNPGGPRHLSHYSFNWAALLRYSKQADEAARGAIDIAKTKRRHNSHKAVMEMPAHNSQGAVIAPFQKKPISNSITAKTKPHNSQNQLPSQPKPDSITAVGLSDIALDIPLSDVAQHITPSQADGGLSSAKNLDRPFVSQSAAQQTEPRRALEGRKKEPPKPLVFFDALVNVLGKDDPKVTVAVTRLGFDQQRRASELLATKGPEQALAYIREHDPKGMAA